MNTTSWTEKLALTISGLLLLPLTARADFSWAYLRSFLPASAWTFVSGQFAGTNLTDLVGYDNSNGSIWVGRNTGFSFAWSQVGFVQPAGGWSFVAGKFGGTGLTDLVGYYRVNGSVWVGLNSGGTKFTWKQVKIVAPASGWSLGQFGGNTLTDLVATNLFPPFFSFIGTNKGSALAWASGIPPTYPSRYALVVGQFAGNSLADLVQYRDNGELWLGVNTAGVK